MAVVEESRENKCWGGCEERENPFALLVGWYTGTAAMEKSMEVAQKIKNTYDPKFPLLGIYPKKVKSLSVFTAALFRIAKTWKQDEWMNR